MNKKRLAASFAVFAFLLLSTAMPSQAAFNLLNESPNTILSDPDGAGPLKPNGALGTFHTTAFVADEPKIGDRALNPAPEGFKVFSSTFSTPTSVRFGGWFIQWGPLGDTNNTAQPTTAPALANLTAFANGSLRFWIKSNLDVSIEMASYKTTDDASAPTGYRITFPDADGILGIDPPPIKRNFKLSDLNVPLDGRWHPVVIPISEFTSGSSGVDLRAMKVLFTVFYKGNTNGLKEVQVDNVRWDADAPPGALNRIEVTALTPLIGNTVTRGLSATLTAKGFDNANHTIDIWPTWTPSSSLSVAEGNTVLFKTDANTPGSVAVAATASNVTGSLTLSVVDPATPFPSALGIISDTVPGLVLDTDSKVLASTGPLSTMQLSDSIVNFQEGYKSLNTHFEINDSSGFAVMAVQEGIGEDPATPTRNVSNFSQGFLRFWVKTPIDLSVSVRSGDVARGEETKVALSSFIDPALRPTAWLGSWQAVAIPLREFSNRFYGGNGNVDLSRAKIFAAVAATKTVTGDFLIDNMRWDMAGQGTLSSLQILPEEGLTSGSPIVLRVGQSVILRAQGRDNASQAVDVIPSWSNNNAATVRLSSPNNTNDTILAVTALAAGDATITASKSGVNTVRYIHVEAQPALDVFGVYSETIPGAAYGDDNPAANSFIGAAASDLSAMPALSDDINTYLEGTKALRARFSVGSTQGSFASVFFEWGKLQNPDPDPNNPVINLSQFRNGLLKFWIKSNTDLKIGITSPALNRKDAIKVKLSELIGAAQAADGQWHSVAVPLNRFVNVHLGGPGNIDLTRVQDLLVLTKDEPVSNADVVVDNVRWERNASGVLASLEVSPTDEELAANPLLIRQSVALIAQGRDAQGRLVDVIPTWTNQDPDVVAFPGANPTSVTDTITGARALKEGTATLTVTAPGLSQPVERHVRVLPSEALSIFGVYSETFPDAILGGDDQNAHIGRAFDTNGTSVFQALESDADRQEGEVSLRAHFTVGPQRGSFASVFVQWGKTPPDPDPDPNNPVINMTQFQRGFLKFFIKSNTDLKIGVVSSGADRQSAAKVKLSDFVTGGAAALDGLQWNAVEIPISRFASRAYAGQGNIDLSRMQDLIVLTKDEPKEDAEFKIDHVRWDSGVPSILTRLQLNPNSDDGQPLALNQSISFSVLGLDNNNRPAAITPAWSVSDPTVARVVGTGTAIRVEPLKEGTVTLTASASAPSGTITASRQIRIDNRVAPEAFGIYSDTLPGTILGGDDQNARLGVAFKGGTTGPQLSDDLNDIREGVLSLKAQITVPAGAGNFASIFFQWGANGNDPAKPVINLSQIRNGSLRFWIKTTTDVKIGLTSKGLDPSLARKFLLSDLLGRTPDPETWYPVSIPLSRFTASAFEGEGNVDLSRLLDLFVITKDTPVDNAQLWIDNVRFENSVGTTVSRIEIKPQSVITVPNLPTLFTAQAFDEAGRPLDAELSWILAGVPGTVTPAQGVSTLVTPTAEGQGVVRATVGDVTAQALIRVEAQGAAAVLPIFSKGNPAGDIGSFPPNTQAIALTNEELDGTPFLKARVEAAPSTVPGWFLDVGRVGGTEIRDLEFYGTGSGFVTFMIRSSQTADFNVSLRSANIPGAQSDPVKRISVRANQTERKVIYFPEFLPATPGGAELDFTKIKTYFSIAPAQAPQSALDFWVGEISYVSTDPRAFSENKILQGLKNKQATSGLVRSFGPANPRAHTYDQALAVLAFLLKGETESARKILSAYSTLVPEPFAGFANTYNADTKEVFIQDDGALRVAGPNAWMLTAMTRFKEVTGSSQFDGMAIKLGNWLLSLEDPQSGGLFFNAAKDKKSSENNLSAIAAFVTYAGKGGLSSQDQIRYQDASSRINLWLAGQMYLPDQKRFRVGTSVAAIDNALDINSWALATFGRYPAEDVEALGLDLPGMRASTESSFINTQTSTLTNKTIQGFDFGGFSSPDLDSVWLEGTGQMVVAYQTVGPQDSAEFYLYEMEKNIVALDATSQGIPYATNPGTAYSGWTMNDQDPAVASMAWYLFAVNKFNPLATDELVVVPPPQNTPPLLTEIVPNSGSVACGTAVTLRGAHFDSNAQVSIGGRAALQTIVDPGHTQIFAVTPTGTLGPQDVVVTNPDGQTARLLGDQGFVYADVPCPPLSVGSPTIERLTPDAGSLSGRTIVTMNGSNFDTQATVTVDGVPAISAVVLSSSKIVFTTPAGSSPGPKTVEVRNRDGSAAQSVFTYGLASPLIFTLTPGSGPTTGDGILITITGRDFTPGASVSFGGVVSPSVEFISANQLRAVLPVHGKGNVAVTVRNPDDQSDTLPNAFTYTEPLNPGGPGLPPPVIITLDPASPFVPLAQMGDGALLNIRPQAVNQAVTIEFERLSVDDVDVPNGSGAARSQRPVSVYSLSPDGLAFNQNFLPILTLKYNDSDNNGMVDGTTIREKNLAIFTWNGTSWELLGGAPDVARNQITIPIRHFSFYAIFPTASAGAESTRPQERILTLGRLDNINDMATFSNLLSFEPNAEIEIFDTTGRRIRKLVRQDQWDGKDEDGNIVASGVYIYQYKVQGERLSGVIGVAR